MENLMLKNMARSLVLAGVITFSAVGVANAAGAGDQTGKHGDMSGHGGSVDKKAGSEGGQKSGPAHPEPSTYQQSGSSTSGQTGGTAGGSAGQGTGSTGAGSTGSGSSGQTGGGGY